MKTILVLFVVLERIFFTETLKYSSFANTTFAPSIFEYILYIKKLNSGTITSSFLFKNNWQSIWIISSDPDPQIILLKSQLYVFEICFLKILHLPSGYLSIFLLLKLFFLIFELKPNADSFAESLIKFFIFPILDFPGLYVSISIFLNFSCFIIIKSTL